MSPRRKVISIILRSIKLVEGNFKYRHYLSIHSKVEAILASSTRASADSLTMPHYKVTPVTCWMLRNAAQILYPASITETPRTSPVHLLAKAHQAQSSNLLYQVGPRHEVSSRPYPEPPSTYPLCIAIAQQATR